MNNDPELDLQVDAPVPAAESPRTEEKKILIAALGGCGAKTLNAFARLPGAGAFP